MGGNKQTNKRTLPTVVLTTFPANAVGNCSQLASFYGKDK